MTDDSSKGSADPEGEIESSELGVHRARIDQIDLELQRLINERASCAHEIAEIKRRESERSGDPACFYRPEREAQVLREVRARNDGPVDREDMVRLFREVMSVCLSLEQGLQVAYLGPEGTFTQAAALKHFGHSVTCVALPTIDEVFREVESGNADYGIVPVENSTEGMVNHTLDSFVASSLRICGEVELRIHHHFLLKPGTDPKSVSRIYSHQQSLGQCRKWLDGHYPAAERVAVASNAEAARRLKTEWHSAAIAGDMAAELYGLDKVVENIEDRPDNTTRFLVIGRQDVAPSGEDKTSILVRVKNRPGALHDLLVPFRRYEISLTRLETRPSLTGPWSYVFFMDFEGHRQDHSIEKALQELAEKAAEVRMLGSYPRAVL